MVSERALLIQRLDGSPNPNFIEKPAGAMAVYLDGVIFSGRVGRNCYCEVLVLYLERPLRQREF
jgi:hypothetical protein